MPIARWLNEHGLPGDLRRLIRLAEVFAYGGTVALIIATAAMLDRRGWRVAVHLAIPAYGAGLVADRLKLLVWRWRPALLIWRGSLDTFVAWLPVVRHAVAIEEQVHQKYTLRLQSFPSAHAATAVGLAIALGVLYPRGRWLFIAFAFPGGAPANRRRRLTLPAMCWPEQPLPAPWRRYREP